MREQLAAMVQCLLLVFSLFLTLLFSRIQIHYSAYYSGQIEYEQNIRYSPRLNWTELAILVAVQFDSLIIKRSLDSRAMFHIQRQQKGSKWTVLKCIRLQCIATLSSCTQHSTHLPHSKLSAKILSFLVNKMKTRTPEVEKTHHCMTVFTQNCFTIIIDFHLISKNFLRMP